MINIFNKFWAWLLLSSEDPNKASLTVKSAFSLSITYIVFFTGIFHRPANPSDLQTLFDQIGTFVGLVLMIFHSVRGIWAAMVKVWKTLKGTNEVINTGTTL